MLPFSKYMKRKINKKLINQRFAKSKMYSRVLKEAIGEKVCPLCHMRWHTNPILKRDNGWMITENFQPYKNAQHHFVIISKKHRENFSELTSSDWQAIRNLAVWALRKFKIRGGGLAMRFGDTEHTGATVSHLHAHLIVPKIQNGKAKPVWFPFG